MLLIQKVGTCICENPTPLFPQYPSGQVPVLCALQMYANMITQKKMYANMQYCRRFNLMIQRSFRKL